MENEALLSPELDAIVNIHPREVMEDRDEEVVVYKLYRRRWLMLAVVTLLTAENLTQWLFYSAIDNIVKYHFSVSSFLGQLLSLNNLAIIMIFGLPSIFIINKTNLKVGCLTSGVLSLIALWVKFFGTSRDGFYLTVVGQIVASFGTCFILPLPAQLASTWFGVFERSTATSIAASGLSFGMGLAYIFSVQFVPSVKDHQAIQDGLQKSIIIQTIMCSLTILLTFVAFEEQPLSPPSPSQAAVSNSEHHNLGFWKIITKMVTSRSYMFTLLGFGITSGVLYAFFSILNDVIYKKFHNADTVGWMGFLGSVVGIPGMLLTGLLLDRTKAYKGTFVLYTGLIACTVLAFTLVIKYANDSLISLIYVIVALFGFLTSGLTTIGFVLAGELTYPVVPEMFSSGMLLVGAQFFGVVTLGVTSYTVTAVGTEFVNFFMAGACFIAFLFTPFVKGHFQRLAEDVLITD